MSTTDVTNIVDWIDDCDPPNLQWWFPLALSASIYLINILYLLTTYLLKRYRPKPTNPHSTAYPNIFRGIDQNDCDEDNDLDFDLDEDPFQRQQYQWLEEMQLGDTEYWKFPSTATVTDTPFENTAKVSESDYGGELRKANGQNPGEHSVSVRIGSVRSLNEEASRESKGRRKGRSKSGKNSCCGKVRGSLNQKIRIYCEQMTSVSYKSGQILVGSVYFSCITYSLF